MSNASSEPKTQSWTTLANPATQTLEGQREGTDTSALSQLELAAEPTLFYRTNLADGWRPTTPALAERLVQTRTWNDPWVTFARPTNPANDPDGHHFYFQVLGVGSHALLVEGGGLDDDGLWDWTSTCLPNSIWPGLVGPTWYQYLVQETEIQTDSDALAQMWVALYGDGPTQQAPPGYRWRPRHRDELPVHTPATTP